MLRQMELALARERFQRAKADAKFWKRYGDSRSGSPVQVAIDTEYHEAKSALLLAVATYYTHLHD
jgi:hypothetical protein